jgi:hypothetical protein
MGKSIGRKESAKKATPHMQAFCKKHQSTADPGMVTEKADTARLLSWREFKGIGEGL